MKQIDGVIFCDSCFYDPPENLPEEIEASEKIKQLHFEEKIVLMNGDTVKREISHKRSPSEKKKESYNKPYSIEHYNLTNDEKIKYDKIKNIIVGNGKQEKYINDVKNIFEAYKLGTTFLTCDCRIIKKRKDIECLFGGFRIFKPTEFFTIISAELNND